MCMHLVFILDINFFNREGSANALFLNDATTSKSLSTTDAYRNNYNKSTPGHQTAPGFGGILCGDELGQPVTTPFTSLLGKE